MTLFECVLEAIECKLRYIAIDFNGNVYGFKRKPKEVKVKNNIIDGYVYITEMNNKSYDPYEVSIFLGEYDYPVSKVPMLLDIKKLKLRTML